MMFPITINSRHKKGALNRSFFVHPIEPLTDQIAPSLRQNKAENVSLLLQVIILQRRAGVK